MEFLEAREALRRREGGCSAVEGWDRAPGVGAVEEDEAEVVVVTDFARPLVRVLRRRLEDGGLRGFEGFGDGSGKGKASCVLVLLAL
jgi:hypothetical protein